PGRGHGIRLASPQIDAALRGFDLRHPISTKHLTQMLPTCSKPRFLAAMLLACCCVGPAVANQNLELLGWIEKIRILPTGMEIAAKLDTGADNSSVHAP